jgi:chemotaxis protein CheD
MEERIVVGISDQKIARNPDILVSYALGSCVGVCLHDRIVRVAGLAHILLPESKPWDMNEYKYADTAVARLAKDMEKLGCMRYRMTAKISGGANMFYTNGRSVGDKNVEAVKKELARLNIRIVAEDVGGNFGRTLEFDSASGRLIVRSIQRGHIEI